MRKTTAMLIAAAVMLTAGCGSETTEQAAPKPKETSSAPAPATSESPQPSPSPTPVDPLVADQALTRSLYYGYSQSSEGGLEQIAAFMAANQHPEHAYSVAECESSLRNQGLTDNYSVSAVPDVAAMAPDPGWALPAGRYTGLVPTGRRYILPLEFTQSDPAVGVQTVNSQVHVTILDGTAYFFQDCDPPTS